MGEEVDKLLSDKQKFTCDIEKIMAENSENNPHSKETDPNQYLYVSYDRLKSIKSESYRKGRLSSLIIVITLLIILFLISFAVQIFIVIRLHNCYDT